MNKSGKLIVRVGYILVGLMMLPGWVYAVGFGNLNVHSKLGEPLHVEVEILSVTETELGTMEVGLAMRSDFATAGIPYPENADDLNFRIDEAPGDGYVVNISTEQLVNEPFLHFLLTVSWSGGKVVREFTALLDPPLYTGAPGVAVETVPIVATDPVDTAADATTPPAPTTVQQPSVATGASTVVVQSGDTLWEIVESLGLSGDMDKYQAMMALVEANPSAFINGNMNRLKAGAVLSIPEADAISQISRGLARDKFHSQAQAYDQYLTGIGYQPIYDISVAPLVPAPAAPAPAAPAPAEQVVSEPAPDIAAGTRVSAPSEARLTIGSEGSDEALSSALEGGQGEEAQLEALKSQLTQLDESLLASGAENEEVRQRLQEIRQQMERVSALIGVEDADLATMTAGEDSAAQQAPDTEEVVVAGDAENEAEVAIEPEPVAEPEVTQPEEEVAEAQQPEVQQPEVQQSASDDTGSASQPSPASTAAEESASGGILDSLLAHALKIIAVIVLLLASVFFYLFYFRKKVGEKKEEDVPDDTDDEVEVTVDYTSQIQDSGLELTVATEYTPAASDDARTYLGEESVAKDTFGGVAEEENEVIQDDMVDPLAEADVYLAYNRDEQAIQVLKEAYEINPERHELGEKLLEIYHKQDDKIAFDELASKFLGAIGSKQHPHWNKVVALGREVSPDNDLYQDAGGGINVAAAEPAESDTVDVDLGSALDLDLGSGLDIGSGLDDEVDTGLDAGFESDLGSELESEFESELKMKATSAEQETGGEFDLDLGDLGDMGDFDEEEAIHSLEPQAGEAGALDDEDYTLDAPTLSQLIGEAEDEDEEPQEAQEQQPAESADTIPDIPDNDSLMTIEQTEEGQPDEQAEGDEEGGYRESETALELAQAYIELGEKDIAKRFIEEVLSDGSDEEKARAQQLIKELSD